MKFAPLHVYSSYSFLQSGLTIQKIVNATKVNDYFGVAICDKEVMYGVPNFAIECEKEKKPPTEFSKNFGRWIIFIKP